MKYNNNTRTKNALLSSASGIFEQVIQIIFVFVYRTVFLQVFTKEYLGINGLFTNILQIFSLAELGIGGTIIYRMYKPFERKNIEDISALIHFYRMVYHGIFLVIILLGFCFYPFIGIIIKENEVPATVNISLVYFLFVLQSATSYLFVYKQSLLTADQKNYAVSLFVTLLNVVSNVVKMILLFLTRNYVLVLAGGVFTTVIFNAGFSIYISHLYSEVFSVKEKLDRNQKKEIFKDTFGLMCHRIGGTVVSSTDNIVLTKFVSLVAVGIYSNYSTVVTAIQNLVNKLINGFVPSIGNYALNSTKEQIYGLYKRLLFANLWIVSCTCVCLFVLLNPFIATWLDDSFLLDKPVVAIICMQYYIQTSRVMSGAFISGCGLFMKDKLRPLIESAINLVVSILLAQHIGIVGVFIGTVVSAVATYYWREPYLLFKEVFPKKVRDYCILIGIWWMITVFMCCLFDVVTTPIFSGWIGFVVRCCICLVGTNVIYVVLMCKTPEYLYYKGLLVKMIIKKFRSEV